MLRRGSRRLSRHAGVVAGLLSLPECAPSPSRRSTESPATIYEHGTLVDGRGGEPVRDAVIVIRDGRIVATGPAASTRVPSGARHVDLRGTTIVPGFVDMHFHATTAAMRYRRAASELDSTYDRALAERLLRVALSMGITTIRDPGASPRAASLSY